MDVFFKHIVTHVSNIYAMDPTTVLAICVLCVVSTYFIKDHLANPIMAIFVYPVLVLFSVLCEYSLLLLELFSPKRVDEWLTWTIVATICGNILGIGIVAIIGRLRTRWSDKRTFKPMAVR